MRSTTAAFCDIFERYFSIPKSTAMHFVQQLREDESIFRRGKRGLGAIEPTTSEIANWTTALCAATATTRKSPDTLDTVRYARAAVRLSDFDLDTRCSAEAIGDLAIGRAKTYGEAVDSLIDDMRSGTFETWKNDQITTLTVRYFNNGGRIVINLTRYDSGDSPASQAVFVYRSDNPADQAASLTYIHEMEGDALEALAKVLGPIPPPPY